MTGADGLVARSSTSFKPGNPGNPHGRTGYSKPAKDLRKWCRERTEEAAAGIMSIARDTSAKAEVRLRAWIQLLEWGWGRPGPMAQDQSEQGQVVDLAQYFPVRIDTSTDGQSSTETAQTAPEASSEGQGRAETAETVR